MDVSSNESEYSGVGGLIIDMNGDHLAFCSARVEKETIEAVLEMLAVLCAFECWQEKTMIHRIVLFTDSESVRGAFFKSCQLGQ